MRRAPPSPPAAPTRAAAEVTELPDQIGPYRVLREVARGGMASVYEVVDPVDGGRLALKLLHQRGAAQLRFIREYESLTRLNHPNILRVFRFGLAEGFGPYLTMELLDGAPAQVYAKSLGRPGAAERTRAVLRVVAEVALALQHLHERGLVHRDLKSSNVLVTREGAVKLLDFGTARPLDEAETITQGGEFVGTFAYASPEQLRGESVDARADLYALGVLAYRLLTGRRPFEGDSPAALAQLHIEAPPRPPCELVPGIAPEVEAIVLAMLQKLPGDRPASAAAVRGRLVAVGLDAPPTGLQPAEPVGLGAVGRSHELDVIEGMIDLAEPGSALVLTGPAGAGAALLLDEAGRRLRARGPRVLSEAFTPGGGLAALVRLARAALRSVGAPTGEQLTALSALSRAPAAGEGDGAAPELAAALLSLVVDPQRLTVLALRDLTFAGAAARATLAALLRAARAAGSPLLVIASAEGASAAARWGAALDGARTVRLQPLSVAEVGALVRVMLGRSSAPAALCRRLHQQGGGRAGYLVELVHAMLAQGQLVLDGQAGWRDLSGGRLALPEPMRGPIDLTLDRLEPEAARALEALAVARVGCGAAPLAAALGRSADSLGPLAASLVEDDLCEGELSDGTLRIAVGAVAELLRLRMRPARRAVLERALAGEVSESEPSLDKARLLLAAGRGAEAAACAVAWCAGAAEGAPPRAAVPTLRACLAAAPEGCAARALLLRALADAVGVDDPRAPEALLLARAAAAEGEGRARGLAELSLSALHRRRGERGAAVVHRQRAEDEASRLGALDLSILVELEAALAAEAELSFDLAEERLGRAMEIAALIEDDAAFARALARAGALRVRRGALREGEAELRQALRAMPEPAPLGPDVEATLALGGALRLQGRFAEAADLLRPALARVRAEAPPAAQAWVIIEMIDLHVDLFRLGEARELLSELSALAAGGVEPALRVEVDRVVGRIGLQSGELEVASAALARGLALAEESGLVRAAHRLRGLMGLALARGGDVEAADRETRVALRELERAGLWPDAADVALCRAAALRGVEPPARALSPVWGWLQRSGARLADLEARVALAEHAHSRRDLEACRGELTSAGCVLDELRAAQGAEADATLRAHPLVRRMRLLHPKA